MQPETMTAAHVCAHLRISRSTLSNRIRDRDITPLPKNPAHKKPWRLYFLRADVERLNHA